jgi:hypothetical protein
MNFLGHVDPYVLSVVPEYDGLADRSNQDEVRGLAHVRIFVFD